MKRYMPFIALLLLGLQSFAQTKKEAINFLNPYLSNEIISSGTNFNGVLREQENIISYLLNIKVTYPLTYNELASELNYYFNFNPNNIKNYTIKVTDSKDHKGLLDVDCTVILKEAVLTNTNSKYFLEEQTSKKIEVRRIELTNSKPIEKENVEKYKKALETLLKT